MSSLKVPWSGRAHKYSQEEIDVVVEIMRNGDPLTQGKYQALFEKKASEKMGVKHAFVLSSGTAALEMAATLSGVGPGDEIILPAHTFCATAIPFARTGAKLVWADLDPETFLVTARQIEPLVTARTKLVIVVHLYGMAAQMDPISEVIKEHNLILVEDAAQAIGARYKEKAVGSFGDYGCFSFHSHKNISTLGEGGMIVVKDGEKAALVPGLRHNGIVPFSRETKTGQGYWQPAMTNVDFDLEGVWPFNFCLGEAQCALGIKLLQRLDQLNEERKKRAARIIKALSDFPEIRFQKKHSDCESVYHLLPAKYDGRKYGKNRDDLIALLYERYSIKTVVQYYPLYRYPLFRKAGFGDADCPAVDDFFDNMLSFPFHHWLSQEQEDYMVESIKKALTALRG